MLAYLGRLIETSRAKHLKIKISRDHASLKHQGNVLETEGNRYLLRNDLKRQFYFLYILRKVTVKSLRHFSR